MWKKNQKRENGKGKKERLDVFKCPPTKPTLQHQQQQQSLSIPLLLSHKLCSPKYPSASPQKIPSSSLSLKRTIFFTELCGLFGFLCLGQSFTEKTGNREPSYLILSPLSLIPCFFLLTLLSLSSPSLAFYHISPTFFLLYVSLRLPDLTMKKMKAIVPMESPYTVYEDQRARLRHQSLLQDYLELQMETEDMRRKLQTIKQKKLILSAEVRFLRQRYKYLIKNPLPKPQPKQDVSQPQKVKIHARTISKSRNYNRKESALRPPIASHLNPKEKISNGVEIKLQKPVHVFDLNQNARSFNGKDGSFHSSSPVLDLNRKDRIHSGKEAIKKSITPFFDLNQISREEEEMQGSVEQPMKIEEPKKSTYRVLSDDQHNDIKLSVCRNVGDGSNRTGKRKISWQDQVALRV